MVTDRGTTDSRGRTLGFNRQPHGGLPSFYLPATSKGYGTRMNNLRLAARSFLATFVALVSMVVVVAPQTGEAGPTTAPVPGPLSGSVCGTWVLQQVMSEPELRYRTPALDTVLESPGVTGLSLRFPWNAIDTDFSVLEEGLAIARRHGKEFSVRFMAGRHTPARVFDAGAPNYVVDGERVPAPFDANGRPNTIFEREYDAFVGRLAAWARDNGVSLLHLAWYGQDWAELNHGKEVRALPGYTDDVWVDTHRRLIDIGSRHAGPDLAVELPLSGYGYLSGGQSATLADKVIQTGKPWYVQANGWGPSGEWGAPSASVEEDFDRIWAKPVPRGVQAIQPEDYDWSLLYANARAVGATYAEVYLPSFQGASSAALYEEAASFRSWACDAAPVPTSTNPSTTTTRPASTTTTTPTTIPSTTVPPTTGPPDPDPDDSAAPTSPAPVWLAIPSNTRIALGWMVSTDDVGVLGYAVVVNGRVVDVVQNPLYVLEGLIPGTLYRIDVFAFDAARHVSEPASVILATPACFLGFICL